MTEQAKRSGEEKEAFEKRLTAEQKEYLADSAAIQKVIDLMKAGAVITKPEAKEEKEEAPKAKKTRAKKAEPKTEEEA